VAQLPDVPTTEEAGFADSEYTFWVGLFAPIKTPRAIVEQLHDRIQVILESPLVREKLKALSIEPMPMSSAEFDVLVRQEGERNKQIVTAAGIKPE
jgi:tripartite-type tricarboxylate transporter receptor subunit TctC